MKAIVNHVYGPPDVLELEDVDAPVPSATRFWCGFSGRRLIRVTGT